MYSGVIASAIMMARTALSLSNFGGFSAACETSSSLQSFTSLAKFSK